MSAQSIVYLLLLGTLVAAIAAAVEATFRLLKWPTRFVWIAALASLACLFIAPVRAPTATLPGARVALSGIQANLSTVTPARSPLGIARGMTAKLGYVLNAALTRTSAEVSPVATYAFVALSLAASAVLLSLVVIINLRAQRAVRVMPRRYVDDVALRVADVGPAVIGLFDPAIVIPQWLFKRSEDEQRLVIAHERQHLAARDQVLPVAGWLCVALVPWHPAAWWMLKRMRLAIELDCDARVLRTTKVSSRRYAELLIDIASIAKPSQLGALALADQPSHLERRLSAMITKVEKFRGARVATLCAAASLAFVVACEARMPTAVEVQNMDVASANASLQRSKLMDPVEDGAKVYTYDGVQLTEAEALKIPAAKIASIQIEKTAGQRSVNMMSSKFVALQGSVNVELRQMKVSGDTNLRVAYATMKDSASLPIRLNMVGGGGMVMTKQSPTAFKSKSDDFPGLVLVDGVEASASVLRTLKSDQIEAVEVVKGNSAKLLSSDPRADYGIIRITTKKQ